MLEKLLTEIKNGGTTSPSVLATRLSTSPEMIQAMLDTLEEHGYLQSVDPGCSNEKPCDSCSLSNMCSSSVDSKPRLRILRDSLR
ncbi:MAG: Uncharacterized protein FD147_1781 [Chloroflexi bacterium]|nr:MAG: Uncharacterized protein FD147_1781 [Chloroflexota bacterium]